MEAKEIIEGNKLIAEFMGGTYTNEPIKTISDDGEITFKDFFQYKLPKDYCPMNNSMNPPQKMSTAFMIENFMYHQSWDWLMPVVEKIEKTTVYDLTTNYDERSEFIGWSVHWFTLNTNNEILGYIEDKRFETKINATWFAVVEFIKYHNKKH